jgi:hypothetical protein
MFKNILALIITIISALLVNKLIFPLLFGFIFCISTVYLLFNIIKYFNK